MLACRHVGASDPEDEWERTGTGSPSALGSELKHPPNPHFPPPAAGEDPIHSNEAAFLSI